jgi:hypothetical protein
MAPKNPLEHLFEQIAEITRLVKEGDLKADNEIPKGTLERLEVLEEATQMLCSLNEDTLEQLGMTKDLLNRTLTGIQNIPTGDKKFLERTKKLQAEVKEVQDRIATHRPQKGKTAENKEKRIADRKKKFHRVGSKKNWKPL